MNLNHEFENLNYKINNDKSNNEIDLENDQNSIENTLNNYESKDNINSVSEGINNETHGGNNKINTIKQLNSSRNEKNNNTHSKQKLNSKDSIENQINFLKSKHKKEKGVEDNFESNKDNEDQQLKQKLKLNPKFQELLEMMEPELEVKSNKNNFAKTNLKIQVEKSNNHFIGTKIIYAKTFPTKPTKTLKITDTNQSSIKLNKFNATTERYKKINYNNEFKTNINLTNQNTLDYNKNNNLKNHKQLTRNVNLEINTPQNNLFNKTKDFMNSMKEKKQKNIFFEISTNKMFKNDDNNVINFKMLFSPPSINKFKQEYFQSKKSEIYNLISLANGDKKIQKANKIKKDEDDFWQVKESKRNNYENSNVRLYSKENKQRSILDNYTYNDRLDKFDKKLFTNQIQEYIKRRTLSSSIKQNNFNKPIFTTYSKERFPIMTKQYLAVNTLTSPYKKTSTGNNIMFTDHNNEYFNAFTNFSI